MNTHCKVEGVPLAVWPRLPQHLQRSCQRSAPRFPEAKHRLFGTSQTASSINQINAKNSLPNILTCGPNRKNPTGSTPRIVGRGLSTEGIPKECHRSDDLDKYRGEKAGNKAHLA